MYYHRNYWYCDQKLEFFVEKKMQSYQVSERTAEHYILKNDVFDLNHALPKMLSKIRLKNMISGKRKQITSATQGGWPQAWNLMST